MTGFNKKILYVDDEQQALKYFKLFYGKDFDIVIASSADEALRIINESADEIGVLVTDQRMPGKTGVELMEQVRAQHPNIVRVLTTAYTNLESAIKSVNEGGAFRYLTKPWNDEEMLGTLLRASEFHAAMTERDRLLAEKLSVLHRLIVMDRVRGLATMTAALNGRIRNAWDALADYMKQSPVSRRIQVQIDEIAALNMVAMARREAESMVRTVQMLLDDVVHSSTGIQEEIDAAALADQIATESRDELTADDLQLTVQTSVQSCRVHADRGMLRRLLQIMLRRLSDIQELPAKLTVAFESNDDEIQLIVRGEFDALGENALAAFFSRQFLENGRSD